MEPLQSLAETSSLLKIKNYNVINICLRPSLFPSWKPAIFRNLNRKQWKTPCATPLALDFILAHYNSTQDTSGAILQSYFSKKREKKSSWGIQVSEEVRILVTGPDDWSSMPRREGRFLQVVLWLPPICHGTCVPAANILTCACMQWM